MEILAMIFKLGDRVSIIGDADPKTVESTSGDDVNVFAYDPERHVLCRQTYKAAMLRLAPRPKAAGVPF
jgi:hypothetical protein